MINETGIIMSGDHPKLILDGIKTMTRRVIKPQPKPEPLYGEGGQLWRKSINIFLGAVQGLFASSLVRYCPYGQVGDRLWVRETWGYYGDSADFGKDRFTKWVVYGSDATQNGIEFDSFDAMVSVPPHQNLKYPQDYDDLTDIEQIDIKTDLLHKWWKAKKTIPSIHMPRWASRIDRIIALLRVERLRDISEADAKAEGGYSVEEFIEVFLRLNHLPEDANPWNWVIGW